MVAIVALAGTIVELETVTVEVTEVVTMLGVDSTMVEPDVVRV